MTKQNHSWRYQIEISKKTRKEKELLVTLSLRSIPLGFGPTDWSFDYYPEDGKIHNSMKVARKLFDDEIIEKPTPLIMELIDYLRKYVIGVSELFDEHPDRYNFLNQQARPWVDLSDIHQSILSVFMDLGYIYNTNTESFALKNNLISSVLGKPDFFIEYFIYKA